MGSSGSYQANLTYRKQIKLKIKQKNTKEDIKTFLEKNPGIVEEKYFGELSSTDKIRKITISDPHEWVEDEIYLTEDLGHPNISKAEFLRLKLYEHKSIEEGELDLEYEDWSYGVEASNLEVKLQYLNLTVLEAYVGSWNPSENVVREETVLGSCSEDLYCDSDNSSSDSFRITAKFIANLSVGDVLELNADGDPEHC